VENFTNTIKQVNGGKEHKIIFTHIVQSNNALPVSLNRSSLI
jgi:hypothetical protein